MYYTAFQVKNTTFLVFFNDELCEYYCFVQVLRTSLKNGFPVPKSYWYEHDSGEVEFGEFSTSVLNCQF